MVTLDNIFTNIANAIREKGSTTAKITPENMPQAIKDIPTGGKVTPITYAINNLIQSGSRLKLSVIDNTNQPLEWIVVDGQDVSSPIPTYNVGLTSEELNNCLQSDQTLKVQVELDYYSDSGQMQPSRPNAINLMFFDLLTTSFTTIPIPQQWGTSEINIPSSVYKNNFIFLYISE